MTALRAGIALGSNLGDRLNNLRSALAALREIAAPGAPVLIAPVYQTEPLHCPPGSPDFLNTAIEIGFTGSPEELLEKALAIELRLGRTREGERNAPRMIDIDLLYFGDEHICQPELVLPHPRLAERAFVLEPLAQIRPDLVLPGMSSDIATLLKDLKTAEPALIRFAETW